VLSLDLRSRALVAVSVTIEVSVLGAFFAAVVLARGGWIGTTLGLLGAGYFGHLLVADQASPVGAAICGVLLLLAGEFAAWSIDRRLPGHYEPGIHIARAIGIGWLAIVTAATATLVVFVATIGR
jgi:hypothetical protein